MVGKINRDRFKRGGEYDITRDRPSEMFTEKRKLSGYRHDVHQDERYNRDDGTETDINR